MTGRPAGRSLESIDTFEPCHFSCVDNSIDVFQPVLTKQAMDDGSQSFTLLFFGSDDGRGMDGE